MRNVLVVLFMVVFVLCITSDSGHASGLQKFGRGLLNIVKAPLEIPVAMMKESKDKNPAYGIVLGPINGAFRGLTRATAGTVEAVTSPVTPPKGYDKPLYEYNLGTSPVEAPEGRLIY